MQTPLRYTALGEKTEIVEVNRYHLVQIRGDIDTHGQALDLRQINPRETGQIDVHHAPGSIAYDHGIIDRHPNRRRPVAEFDVDILDKSLIRIARKVKGQRPYAVHRKVHFPP